MDVLLVSYPRSGNTFLRNVLFEVFGVESATYLLAGHGPDANWANAAVVKTHLLPTELPETLLKRKIVLLVRDGRDSVVSFAHHRKDIVAPESTIEQNLWEAIYAAEGSHFGGWSLHTESWLPRADLIIRFEELINDPLAQCLRLKQFMEMNEPKVEHLPSFHALKTGRPEYGSGKYLQGKSLAEHWFRRGEVNAWRDEMTEEMKLIFWHLHGETMQLLAYTQSGDPELGDPELELKHRGVDSAHPIRVLIEASKVNDPFVDGIKRYVCELLEAAQRWPIGGIEPRALVDGEVMDIREALALSNSEFVAPKNAFVQVAKRALKASLPNRAYAELALYYSTWKWHRKQHHKANALGFESPHVVHLTLPQHFQAFAASATSVVATIHDLTHLSHPKFHDEQNVQLCATGMQWLAGKNTHYLAVSASTQYDLMVEGLRSSLVYEGVNRRKFYPVKNANWLAQIAERYALPQRPFLLSVCTLEPRKNLRNLIAAYGLLSNEVRENYPLVLVGRKGWKWESLPPELKNQVYFTGFVRDSHLNAIYAQAIGFCYVSQYEGFGLPVLEAMASGCPVLVSNQSSLPEIAGDVGLLCDPNSPANIASGLMKLIGLVGNDDLRKRCIERSWLFSWRNTWINTARAYAVASGRSVEAAKNDQSIMPN